MSLTITGQVRDAGGGEITVVLDRPVMSYPPVGSRVSVIIEVEPASLEDLFAAMIARQRVRVLVDVENGLGGVKKAGWITRIQEIRRPALDETAYGHLDPVIVVDGAVDPTLSVNLRPSQLAMVATTEGDPS